MEELIINAVGNIGVPAVITIYLLIKFDKTLAELSTAIKNQTEAIRRLEDKVL